VLEGTPVPRAQPRRGLTPRAPHWPKGFREDFLGYLICIHISFTTQTATQTINYMVDKFTQDVTTQPRPSLSLEVETLQACPLGMFSSHLLALPTNGKTAQVRTPAD